MAKEALLAAILEDPDDDDARRVYADALIAEGDPRGEFIAMQLAGRDADASPFEATLRELDAGGRWWWERGFLRAIEIAATQRSVGLLRQIFAVEPIVELATDEASAALLAIPGIERVRRLAATVDDAMAICDAESLRAVRELRIGGPIRLAALGMASLDSVTHLALGYPETDEHGIDQLAGSPLGERLEILELHHQELTVPMAKAIIAMPSLHTFVYTRGYADDAKRLLVHHFGKRARVSDLEVEQAIPLSR